MKKLCIALSLMTVICASYADIYKWIDNQGNVHFSDTPHPGAQKLNIPDPPSFSSPSFQSTSPEKMSPNGSEEKKHTYTTVEIEEPDNGATIRNNQGAITVKVHTEPDLFPGDKLQMFFDGNPLGKPQDNLVFELSNVYRGSHNIAVQVLDPDGQLIETSDPITVYVFRPRVGMVPKGK